LFGDHQHSLKNEGMAGVSRSEFLQRGAALLALPRALDVQGWLEQAYAARPDVVLQTMNGLVAFVVPGRDRYSAAQGTKTKTPGGIEAGATKALIRTLDTFLPSTPPLSSAAATILNEVAANVAPSARRGKFASAFANLSVAQKAKVFQTLEGFQGEEAGSIRFLAGNLPGLTAFVAYSEAGSFDRRRRRLFRRPLGWRLVRYAGVAEGRAEFKGYYQGRRAAEP
jgi:hypothetical protein